MKEYEILIKVKAKNRDSIDAGVESFRDYLQGDIDVKSVKTKIKLTGVERTS